MSLDTVWTELMPSLLPHNTQHDHKHKEDITMGKWQSQEAKLLYWDDLKINVSGKYTMKLITKNAYSHTQSECISVHSFSFHCTSRKPKRHTPNLSYTRHYALDILTSTSNSRDYDFRLSNWLTGLKRSSDNDSRVTITEHIPSAQFRLSLLQHPCSSPELDLTKPDTQHNHWSSKMKLYTR